MKQTIKQTAPLGWLKRQVFKHLQQLNVGLIIWQDGISYQFGDQTASLRATVSVHDQKFYRQFVWRGSIGAAESYIAGDWDCDDLTTLLQIVIANQALFTSLEGGWSTLSSLINRFKNALQRNSIRKNREHIKAHYDLSNDFFALILDRQQQYSSAVFADKTLDLDSAQTMKLRRICEKLELKPTDHLLEIGSGWGGLAIFAAQQYGCNVTTTTISSAQYTAVKQKIAKLGLTKQIHLIKQDYRELTGQYDKLVSIEMIEAVGHRHFNTFFNVCNQRLKKQGLFFLQAIVIQDNQYERYKHELDFIKAYIFPGGCLPALAVITEAIKHETTMRIVALNDIGQDYALTLKHWSQRLFANSDAIKQLGFSQAFIRTFAFYFCYCRAGFLAEHISDIQLLIKKQ